MSRRNHNHRKYLRASPLLLLLLLPLTALANEPAVENPRALWGRFHSPERARPQALGGYSNGCLLGAARLPADGPGYQAVELQRNRRFGHPVAVRYVQELGQRVVDAGLGRMMVGDIAQPRGGPAWRHGSHQTGLDVDIWLRVDQPELSRARRRNMQHPDMVIDDAAIDDAVIDGVPRRINPALWSDAQAELVRLAASDERVSRIFLDAAIKRDLCDHEWEDRSWLRKIRHWRNHTDHLHVRLACPRDSRRCVDQAAPPAGEGCGEELDAILNPPPRAAEPAARAPRPIRQSYRPPMPDRCTELLEELD